MLYSLYMFLIRDEKEERKKQARSNKQTRQSNTAHPRQSLFLEKNELPRVGLEPTTLTYNVVNGCTVIVHVLPFCTFVIHIHARSITQQCWESNSLLSLFSLVGCYNIINIDYYENVTVISCINHICKYFYSS